MFKQYMEHREFRQLRKDHLAKQKRRQALIIFAVLGAILAAMAVVELATKTEPSKPVAAVSKVATQETQEIQNEQQETSDIERFALIVTKPLETLTGEDLDFIGEKEDDPCYASNTQLPRDQMVEAIWACKSQK